MGAKKIMNIKQIAKIKGGQDGAIFKNFLFRFDHTGKGFVYDLNSFSEFDGEEAKLFAEFSLDRSDILPPHSNAVMFGCDYFDEEDEFPVLYSNIYNNFAGTENPLKGVCLAYRVMRNGNEFSTELIQMIEVGFTENSELWCSENVSDIRPYGNFIADCENGMYYGFTMRDEENKTRYFSFSLPDIKDGEESESGIKRVVLNEDDIKEYFDCEYHRFIQGACFHNGKIYSLEGFEPGENPPAMRIVDVSERKQTEFVDLVKIGLVIEPEFIDFSDEVCYYGDHHGNLYIIEF